MKKIFLLLFICFTFGAHSQTNPSSQTFVLVHGAWHGGWCWQDVSRILRADGNLVYTPTLSGLGEHKNTPADAVDLQTHIADIVNLIELEDLHNVVLVGHSYAGAVIAGVADHIPERLSKLVFLDAMVVKDGESALSIQPKETQDFMNKLVVQKQNVPPVSVAEFGVSDSIKMKWANARLTPQPYKTFIQKQELKHPFGNGVPLVYIACINPQLPVIKRLSDEVKQNPQWKFFTLNTGHDAMLTVPKELSDLLISLANSKNSNPDNSMSTKNKVNKFYEILSGKSKDSMESIFADEVDWNLPGNAAKFPWVGKRKTKAEVLEFFKLLSEHIQPEKFEVEFIACNGENAVAVGHLTSTILKYHKSFSTEFTAIFKVVDNKIVKYHFMEDSYTLNEMMKE